VSQLNLKEISTFDAPAAFGFSLFHFARGVPTID
jgi:hypothetical protein